MGQRLVSAPHILSAPSLSPFSACDDFCGSLDKLEEQSRVLSTLSGLGFRLFHSEVNFFEPSRVVELAFIHGSLVQPEGRLAR